VGKEVREAIRRIGGVMPENIPAAEHISEVEKRIKTTPPLLELEEKDAKGLAGKNTRESS
jgi:DNA-damage-inducible protein D